MLHSRIANDDGLARNGRVFDREVVEVDFHDLPRFSEQRRNLVQQTDAHAHELIFGGAAQFGEIHPLGGGERREAGRAGRVWAELPQPGPSEAEREQLPDGQGGGDLQRGGTAHARAHGNGPMNSGVEAAEMDAAFAQLIEHSLDIIRPGRGGVFVDFIQPKYFRLREGGRNEFNLAVIAGCGGRDWMCLSTARERTMPSL